MTEDKVKKAAQEHLEHIDTLVDLKGWFKEGSYTGLALDYAIAELRKGDVK